MPKPRLTLALLPLVFVPLISLYPLTSAVSADSDFKWRRLNIPTEGSAGNWVLARGSDVKCLTCAKDGTLYAYANPLGTNYRLFKSRDNGAGWAFTGDVTGDIVDIAAAPDDASVVYYATTSSVYRSNDGALTFIQLPPAPGLAGTGNMEITSIDVARGDSGRFIAVAIKDKDAGQFGGVYTLDENNPFAWQNTGASGYDVYSVAFSPDYYYDRQIMAVVNNETDTMVIAKSGAAGWGAVTGNARLSKDNSVPPSPLSMITGASIAFPEGYSGDLSRGNNVFFIAVNTGAGDGDVYRIDSAAAPNLSATTDLNAGMAASLRNVDTGSLAVAGKMPNAALLAGSVQDSRVYSSRDGGKNWAVSGRAPTGNAITGIIPAADFLVTGRAFATTAGTESGFSISHDFGLNWNQQSLVDTFINITGITDIAPSPNYAKDRTLFLLALGTKYHLFRSTDSGGTWERILSSAIAGVDSLKMVRLPPSYGRERRAVYLSGTSSGSPAVWRSMDNGETWNRFVALFTVDVMTVVDDNTLIIGGMQSGSAWVASSSNGGFFFNPKVACGSQALKSIALSSTYDQDRTILAGNSDGWIFCSQDGGTTFRPLPPEATAHPLTGSISVAFDPGFNKNHIVYAASNTLDTGIYRFNVGTSQAWERLDTSLPTGSTISQIAVSPRGALYAANSKTDAGLERSVSPTSSSGATFETFTGGLSSGAKLVVLAVSGNQLFAGDTGNGYLFTLGDSLINGVKLNSPPDKAQGTGMLINHTVRGITLDWDSQSGATGYKWQLSPTTDFSSLPAGFEGEGEGSKAVLPALEPATHYYWRVRVSEPVLSPWSDTWSFTTSLGEAVMAPGTLYPTAGANSQPLRPVFQWEAIAGAESYELIVAADAALASPVISRTGEYAIPGTAWESNILLDYSTTYYWKVRGVSAGSKSAWSNVSVFRTEAKPVSLPSPTPAAPAPVAKGDTKPAPEQPRIETIKEVTPAWMYYFMAAQTAIIILLIIILLIVVLKVYL